MTREILKNIDKRILMGLAQKKFETSINSIKSSIQLQMEEYRTLPDARQTWSDTSRSRAEADIHRLQRQLIEEQINLDLFVNSIKEKPAEIFEMGALARVNDQHEESLYLLVSKGGTLLEIQEINMSIYLISEDSPIGRALSGHRAGDVVEAKTPGGEIKFEIKEIY